MCGVCPVPASCFLWLSKQITGGIHAGRHRGHEHRPHCCFPRRSRCSVFSSGRRSGGHRTVAVGNPRGLKHAGKIEQEIAESCNRLIKNCIICWNHLYMTRRFEAAGSPEERDRLLSMIAVHSPQRIESESRLRAQVDRDRAVRTAEISSCRSRKTAGASGSFQEYGAGCRYQSCRSA